LFENALGMGNNRELDSFMSLEDLAMQTLPDEIVTKFISGVSAGDMAMCEHLIGTYPDLANAVDTTSEKPRSGLIIASTEGHTAIALLLLYHGADPDGLTHPDQLVPAPIHAAVDNGHVEIVRLLIDYGADLQRESTYEETPLEIAMDKENDEITAMLLEAGAPLLGRSQIQQG